MGIEEIEIDGQLITIYPPVSNIKLNKKKVTYQDGTGATEASFSSESFALQFAEFMANF